MRFSAKVRNELKHSKLLAFTLFIYLTALIITATDIVWTPYLLERYRMDVYFLMGIGAFITVGALYNSLPQQKGNRLCSTAVLLSVCAIISSFLFYLLTVANYFPEDVTAMARTLGLE